MRYPVLLLLLPLVAACEDALGPAGGCEREMRQVRQNNPGRQFTSSEGKDGDISWERWLFPPTADKPGFTVTFRWGTSLNGCDLDQGGAFSLIPS